jgi:hypothetical protein
MPPNPSKDVLWLLAVLLAAGAGCEQQTFASIDKHTVPLANFERQEVPGHQQMVLDPQGTGYVQVPSDVIHPEFIAHWTNLKREVEVDFYVVPYEDYDPQKPPEQYVGGDGVLWPRLGGLAFGESRPTEIHVHPHAGRWVLFFYNSLDNAPANTAELSAQVDLNFWK